MTRDSVLVTRPLGGSFSVNRSREGVSTSGLSSGVAGVSPGGGVPCQGGNGLRGRPQHPREGGPVWAAAAHREPRGRAAGLPQDASSRPPPREACRTHAVGPVPDSTAGSTRFPPGDPGPRLPRGGARGRHGGSAHRYWRSSRGTSGPSRGGSAHAGLSLLTWAGSETPSLGCRGPSARVFSGTSACRADGIGQSSARAGPPPGRGAGRGARQGHGPGPRDRGPQAAPQPPPTRRAETGRTTKHQPVSDPERPRATRATTTGGLGGGPRGCGAARPGPAAHRTRRLLLAPGAVGAADLRLRAGV